MGRILRTNQATEDAGSRFSPTPPRSSSGLVERRREAFARIFALLSDNPGLGSRRLRGSCGGGYFLATGI